MRMTVNIPTEIVLNNAQQEQVALQFIKRNLLNLMHQNTPQFNAELNAFVVIEDGHCGDECYSLSDEELGINGDDLQAVIRVVEMIQTKQSIHTSAMALKGKDVTLEYKRVRNGNNSNVSNALLDDDHSLDGV